MSHAPALTARRLLVRRRSRDSTFELSVDELDLLSGEARLAPVRAS